MVFYGRARMRAQKNLQGIKYKVFYGRAHARIEKFTR